MKDAGVKDESHRPVRSVDPGHGALDRFDRAVAVHENIVGGFRYVPARSDHD